MPLCTSRCGYCDFNTYTIAQLGPSAAGEFVRRAHAEIALAHRLLSGDGSGAAAPGPLASVFVGGGTPTVLSPADLGGLLDDARTRFGLTGDAEVTCEANPETLTPAVLDSLRQAGFTRLSLGMQSGVPHVLRALDRVHTPGQAGRAVRWAHDAGFASVNVDLIFGAPGETLDDWRGSLEAALAAGPEHVSAYALIVEDGTPLGRRVAAGAVSAPDEDEQADKYLLAEEVLVTAGLANYEISNWARPGHECRHNLGYWRGDSWWGVGPGAHSHVGGFRWWNHRLPVRWGRALDEGAWPVAGHERLGTVTRHEERVLLELRCATGLPLDVLTASERARLPRLAADGLIDPVGTDETVRLTLTGRLLADKVTRDLLD